MTKKSSIIPYFFIIFFLTFICVDTSYIYISQKTWRGLATEDGYQKGLKYNQSIIAAKEQKRLGWNLEIQYLNLGKKSGKISVNLLDRNQRKITDATLTAKIKRPVQDGEDFTLSLKLNNKNLVYESLVEFPLIGQWQIEIIAEKDEKFYQDIKMLVIN